MEVYPYCGISEKLAVAACIVYGCRKPAFICGDCPHKECQTRHIHNGRQASIKWEEVLHKALSIHWEDRSHQKLLEETISISEELDSLKGLIENVKRQLENVLSYENRAKRILKKLESGKHDLVGGNDIALLMKDTSGYLIGRSLQILDDNFDSCISQITAYRNRIRHEVEEEELKQVALRNSSIQPTKTEVLSADELCEIGGSLSSEGKIEAAIDVLDKALALDSKHTKALVKRATLKFKINKLEDSVVDLSEAISLGMTSSQTFKLRAIVYSKLNNPQKEEEDINMMIELNPEHMEGYKRRANIYKSQMKFESAEKDYLKCLELQPANWEVHASLGALYYEIGDNAKADKYLSKALLIRPTLHQAYYLRSKLNSNAGIFSLAIKDLNMAIALKSDSEYLRTRSYLHRLMGNLQEAELDYYMMTASTSTSQE